MGINEELNKVKATRFIKESNFIEGIDRAPTNAEISEHLSFIKLEKITIDDLNTFVSVYQPNAILRDKKGLDVRVDGYLPPRGGDNIINSLNDILNEIDNHSMHFIHCIYESLHPFTDCNGRSGRVIWAWQFYKKYKQIPDKFLQLFYYQTLENFDDR